MYEPLIQILDKSTEGNGNKLGPQFAALLELNNSMQTFYFKEVQPQEAKEDSVRLMSKNGNFDCFKFEF